MNNLFNSIKSVFMKKEDKPISEPVKVDYMEQDRMKLIEKYFTDNDDEHAYELLKEELNEHPENGYAHFFLAQIFWGHQRLGPALTEINAAISQMGGDLTCLSTSYVIRARIHRSLGNEDQMKADLQKCLSIQPDKADVFGELGEYYYGKKMYDVSDEKYRRLAKLQPGNPFPELALGRSAMEQDRLEEAKRHFEYAIRLDSHYPFAYSFLADCLKKEGKMKEAVDNYMLALCYRNNEDNAAYNLLFAIPWDHNDYITSKIEEMLQKESNNAYWPHLMGQFLFFHGEFQKSIPFYEESFFRGSGDVGLGNMARAYYELGMYEKAGIYARRAVNVNPNNDNAQGILANSAMNMELYEEAIDIMKEYLPLKGDDPAIHDMLADCYRASSGYEYQTALTEAEQAVKLAPEQPRAYYTRAKIHHDLENFEAEKADLEKCLSLIEESVIYNSLRCKTLLMLHRVDEAFQELAKREPEEGDDSLYQPASNSDYDLDRAIALAMTGRNEEAIASLNNAFKHGFRRFRMLQNTPLLEPLLSIAYVEIFTAMDRFHSRLGEDAWNQKVDEVGGTEIPFTREGDTCWVTGEVNGLPLRFVFDTGASDISISSVEAAFMLKNGYLEERDLGGVQHYRTASGDLVEGTVVNLRNVTLGGVPFHDLRASIIKNQDAPLLLGQSMIARFMQFHVDNEKSTISFVVHGKIYDSYNLELYANQVSSEEK